MTVTVLTGVAGSGKSTVGHALAARLGAPFLEGDDRHTAANVAKMRSGIPLDDADRAPWLAAIEAWIGAHRDGGVVSCSALKRDYRDRLRAAGGGCVRFVLLDIAADAARARVAGRADHFMPATLVDSQVATLERAQGEADLIVLDAMLRVPALVDGIAAWLERFPVSG